MEINEIKKDLYKSKALATFAKYQKGQIFYNVKIFNELYQFPIAVVEINIVDDDSQMLLSADLGSTPFLPTMDGKHLIRWISKAVEEGDLVKLG